MTSKRAVILMRASMDADDRTTLVTQEHECRGYASAHSMAVVGVFTDDGKSGYKPGTPRPGFDAAMKMIATGQADVLIVWKLDRMVRNLMRFMEAWNAIDKAGGQFVSVVEQFDTTTTMGKLMLMIVAAFAEMESEMKRDRALPFHALRKRNGLPPGGPRPYGYVRENGTLTQVSDEAALVQEMARQVIAGMSLTKLHDHLISMKALGSKNVPITLRGIKRILCSPTTAGLRELDGEYVVGTWKPILERNVWEQVRTILNDPARRTNFTDGQPAYLLSAFIKCAECERNPVMTRKNHPKGLRYLCRQCNSSIPMKVAHEAVEAWLLSSIDAEAWKRLREQGQGYNPDVIAALEAEAEELADMKVNGELTMTQFRKLNADIAERMAAATNQEPLDLPDIDDLQSGWETLDLSDKRTIIGTLLEMVQCARHELGCQGIERIMIERATL